MQDNAPGFLANPPAFIAGHPIVLNDIAPGGMPAVNNLRTRFTLSTVTVNGLPGPGQLPMLRMQPVGGPAVVPLPPPGGGVLSTIDALYCRAGNGGDAFNALPWCDIAAAPGGADAHVLFTTGMNGCSLVVASAVPPGAAALAPGHWRVMHDHDHRSLAQWHAAGYVIRFASYVDGPLGAGPLPAWPVAPVVNNYNPHNYAFAVNTPQSPPPGVRVVTNFLWWNGAHWTFNSRHYAAFAAHPYDIDAMPPPNLPSTQSVGV